MKRMKHIVIVHCGLFMVWQGLASASYVRSPTKHAAGTQTVSIERCQFPVQSKNMHMCNCCSEHCSDMVSCYSSLAAPPAPITSIAYSNPVAPIAILSASFIAPDPDPRLRPPTSLLGCYRSGHLAVRYVFPRRAFM